MKFLPQLFPVPCCHLDDTLAKVKERHDAVVSHIRTQFEKKNTKLHGLILWIQPNVDHTIYPEPLHLKAIVNYLLLNCHYTSTGFDVCEIIELDDDTKYSKISLLYFEYIRYEKALPCYGEKELDVEALQKIKRGLDIPTLDEDEIKKWAASKDIKEIIATAESVRTDIFSQKIVVAGDIGMCV